MSMIGNFLRVSNTELEEYLADSSLLEDRIYNDESDSGDPNLMDIDKAWDGIIFLLTGASATESDDPLADIFINEQVIDEDQDMGYGPACYLTPDQVKELNSKISAIDPNELAKNYDAKKMHELDIYPNAWEDPQMLDYLIDYFKDIQISIPWHRKTTRESLLLSVNIFSGHHWRKCSFVIT